MSSENSSTHPIDKLTDKQFELLRLLGEGFTGKEIASELSISYSAVSQRIETLRRKFGGVSKNEIARISRRYFTERSASLELRWGGTQERLSYPNHMADYYPASRLYELTFSDSRIAYEMSAWRNSDVGPGKETRGVMLSPSKRIVLIFGAATFAGFLLGEIFPIEPQPPTYCSPSDDFAHVWRAN